MYDFMRGQARVPKERRLSMTENTIVSRLFALQDMDYRAFQCKLMPTVPTERVIGVRTPALRRLAKELAKTPVAEHFLRALPHQYYEENNLHGFLIEQMRDYGQTVAAVDAFLPFVDNWATCDLMSPRVFAKNLPALLTKIEEWIHAEHTYTIRFGVGMLLRYYLDEQFQPAYLEMAAGICSKEYYVNMMIAWYFATALAKQYEAAAPFLQNRRLGKWTHNKAIQKAIESDRVSSEHKAYLRTLKIK